MQAPELDVVKCCAKRPGKRFKHKPSCITYWYRKYRDAINRAVSAENFNNSEQVRREIAMTAAAYELTHSLALDVDAARQGQKIGVSSAGIRRI